MDRDQEGDEDKVCNKTFTNVGSLSGHMRSHLSFDSSFDRAGYGLRENPKKAWRVSNLNKLECNKGNVEVDSESSQSESEITDSTVSRKRRRLKRVAAICDDSLLLPDSDKEQEDGAMILTMLSRDFDCFERRTTEIDNVELKKSNGFYQFDPESWADRFEEYNDIDSDKRSRYKCRTCNRVFSSYQALGGHRASHNADRNTGTKTVKRLKKRRKDHECPVCGKTTTSGQALGGHKRSHWAANSGTANSIDIRFQVCNGED